MKIKNTDASYCKILNTKISGMNAYITVLLYSSKPQITPVETTDGNNVYVRTNRVFCFYLRDLTTGETTQISPNNYWIDRNNNYDNDATNIDVNMYKEIILEVDITNSNQAEMKERRWVRQCQLVLMDTTVGTPTEAWTSEEFELISKEAIIPEISNIRVSGSTITFKMTYESQEDFNYINSNLKTMIKIYDVYSNNLIYTQEKTNDTLVFDDYDNVTFDIDSYTSPVIIHIIITNLKDESLYDKEIYYNPAMAGYNLYVKGVGNVIAVSTKAGAVTAIQSK